MPAPIPLPVFNLPFIMTPDHWAILTLSLYALIGVVVMVRPVMKCVFGWEFGALYLLSRLWTNVVFWQRITHRCPLPLNGGALLLANHRSPVDPMLILSASGFKQDGFRLRVLEFMTAREYCNMPGTIGWLCGVMQSIPVERDGKDMGPAKVALRRLREGKIVGIFPEGGINTGPGLLPFNEGVAWLALRSGVPVYPVFLTNAPQEGSMVEPFYTFGKTDITWGDPVDLSAFADEKPTPALLKEVAEYLRQHMAALGGVSDETPPAYIPEQESTTPRVFAG